LTGMLLRFPKRILIVLLLVASFLQYVKFDQYEVSLTILIISMIKYFGALVILGIAGVCVINIFFSRGFRFLGSNPLTRFTRRFPIVSGLLVAGVYAVIATLEGYFGTHAGISPWILFAATFLSKAIGAFCMAMIALCIREHQSFR
jgi:hypothetical protein